MKCWGNVKVVEGDLAMEDPLSSFESSGRGERERLFEVEAWDVSCSQHIHKQLSECSVTPVIDEPRKQIQILVAELQFTKTV